MVVTVKDETISLHKSWVINILTVLFEKSLIVNTKNLTHKNVLCRIFK